MDSFLALDAAAAASAAASASPQTFSADDPPLATYVGAPPPSPPSASVGQEAAPSGQATLVTLLGAMLQAANASTPPGALVPTEGGPLSGFLASGPPSSYREFETLMLQSPAELVEITPDAFQTFALAQAMQLKCQTGPVSLRQPWLNLTRRFFGPSGVNLARALRIRGPLPRLTAQLSFQITPSHACPSELEAVLALDDAGASLLTILHFMVVGEAQSGLHREWRCARPEPVAALEDILCRLLNDPSRFTTTRSVCELAPSHWRRPGWWAALFLLTTLNARLANFTLLARQAFAKIVEDVTRSGTGLYISNSEWSRRYLEGRPRVGPAPGGGGAGHSAVGSSLVSASSPYPSESFGGSSSVAPGSSVSAAAGTQWSFRRGSRSGSRGWGSQGGRFGRGRGGRFVARHGPASGGSAPFNGGSVTSPCVVLLDTSTRHGEASPGRSADDTSDRPGEASPGGSAGVSSVPAHWVRVCVPVGEAGLFDSVRAVVDAQPSFGAALAPCVSRVPEFARERGADDSVVEEVRAAAAAILPHLDPDQRIVLTPVTSALPSCPQLRASAVNDLVDELLACGAVRVVSRSAVRLCHQQFLVPKEDGFRLIDDLRGLNDLLPAPPAFSHPNVRGVFASGARCCAKLDLRSAFYQVPLSRAFAPFTAFLYRDVTYVWDALPMGLAWSPWLFDCMLRPFDVFWAASGVQVVRYADDILVLALDPPALLSSLRLVVESLCACGWSISSRKTFVGPYSVIDFLGVTIDLDRGCVGVSPRMRTKVSAALSAILSRSAASLEELRALAGRLSFVGQCVPLIGGHRRLLDLLIASWSPRLSATAVDPLAPSVLSEVGGLLAVWTRISARRWPAPRPGRRVFTAWTDASDVGVGFVVQCPDKARLVASFPLSRVDVPCGSGVREYDGVYRLLGVLGGRLRAGDEVVLHLDAQVVVFALGRGTSRAEEMVRKAKQVLERLLALPPIVLRTLYVPRAENAEADAASRAVGWPDCTLDPLVLRGLCLWAFNCPHPMVDLFACPTNAVVSRFYARVPTVDAIGVDGLAASPESGAYAYPPFALARLALDLLHRFRAAECSLLLVVPLRVTLSLSWPSHRRLPLGVVGVSPPPYDALLPAPEALIALCALDPLSSPPQDLILPGRSPAADGVER